MSTEAIALSQPLHERVYERIRDSIGDLMTDEDLKILVDKATEKAFFEKPINPNKKDRWDHHPEFLDPPFVTMIHDLLKDDVKKGIATWIKEHPDEITAIINERIDAGIVQMVMRAFDSKLAALFMDFENRLRQSFQIP